MNDGDREKLDEIHKTLKIMTELLLDIRNAEYERKKDYVPDRNMMYKVDRRTWNPYDGVIKEG